MDRQCHSASTACCSEAASRTGSEGRPRTSLRQTIKLGNVDAARHFLAASPKRADNAAVSACSRRAAPSLRRLGEQTAQLTLDADKHEATIAQRFHWFYLRIQGGARHASRSTRGARFVPYRIPCLTCWFFLRAVRGRLWAMTEDARRARAEGRRQHIVIHRSTLGAEVESLEGTPGERVALAVALTRAAWVMTGQPWPEAGVGRAIVNFVPRGAE
jgi:hypothetical protein